MLKSNTTLQGQCTCTASNNIVTISLETCQYRTSHEDLKPVIEQARVSVMNHVRTNHKGLELVIKIWNHSDNSKALVLEPVMQSWNQSCSVETSHIALESVK